VARRHAGRIAIETIDQMSEASSVAAQAGSALAVHYSAAKAGVIAATRSYARQFAKEGITVNAIAPALVATEMLRSNPHSSRTWFPSGASAR
jgi:3-oxoacyl-[acyl-carrier protein] reductase